MSGFSNLLFLIILSGGFRAGNYYRRALKGVQSYSGNDLQTMSLDYALLKWKFITGYLLLEISFFLFVFLNKSISINFIKELMVIFLMSSSIYFSLFALFTDAYPIPTIFDLNLFIHDVEKDIRKTALNQLGIDFVICAAGILLL
jgi:hypothetical protein